MDLLPLLKHAKPRIFVEPHGTEILSVDTQRQALPLGLRERQQLPAMPAALERRINKQRSQMIVYQ